MPAKITEQEAKRWLKENAPHISILEWGGKATRGRSRFIDHNRNVEFDYIFNDFKKVFRKNPNNLFGGTIDEISQKRKKTNIEKYGVENPSQNEEIKEKVRQTNLEKYGVPCSLQNKDVAQKTKRTKVEKYGVDHHMKVEKIKKEIKRKERETKIKNGVITIVDGKSLYEWSKEDNTQSASAVSKNYKKNIKPNELAPNKFRGEEIIKHFLIKKLNFKSDIDFYHNKKLPEHKKEKKKKGFNRPDFLFPVIKLIIEVDGDQIHGNPKFWGLNDWVGHRKNPILAKDKWEKDKRSNQLYESFGYKVLRFWEDEIINERDKVRDEIRKVLFSLISQSNTT